MVTASYGHYGQRAARFGPHRVCRIRLFASVSAPFFQRKCKTDLDLIWTSWSGFGQTHLVWKQAGVQESSGPVSGRTQTARYQFPTFRLGSVFPQTSRIILCKTSPDPVWFWLIKRIRSGSKPVCNNHPARFWPLLPSRSSPNAACLLS